MIGNCQGCKYELEDAYIHQCKGLYLANSLDMKGSMNLGSKGHFFLVMVNDNGKIVVE